MYVKKSKERKENATATPAQRRGRSPLGGAAFPFSCWVVRLFPSPTWVVWLSILSARVWCCLSHSYLPSFGWSSSVVLFSPWVVLPCPSSVWAVISGGWRYFTALSDGVVLLVSLSSFFWWCCFLTSFGGGVAFLPHVLIFLLPFSLLSFFIFSWFVFYNFLICLFTSTFHLFLHVPLFH